MLPRNPYDATSDPVTTRVVERVLLDGTLLKETTDAVTVDAAGGRDAAKTTREVTTSDGRRAALETVQRCARCDALLSHEAARACNDCRRIQCPTCARGEVCRSCWWRRFRASIFRLS